MTNLYELETSADADDPAGYETPYARVRPLVDATDLGASPEGAHKVTTTTQSPVRVAIFSTKHEPSIAIYPDSDKVGAWPPGKLFRLGDAVDYWEGEL